MEQLLNETNLNVFVYTGHMDLIVDTPGKLIISLHYIYYTVCISVIRCVTLHFYSDIILGININILGTLLWVEKLKWKGANTWKNSVRYPLVAEDIVEGYSKAQDNFRMYWVNRAGHMVRIHARSAFSLLSFKLPYL